MQGAPSFVASRTPFHGFGGKGSCHRTLPRGGCAWGMPRNSAPAFDLCTPRICPKVVNAMKSPFCARTMLVPNCDSTAKRITARISTEARRELKLENFFVKNPPVWKLVDAAWLVDADNLEPATVRAFALWPVIALMFTHFSIKMSVEE